MPTYIEESEHHDSSLNSFAEKNRYCFHPIFPPSFSMSGAKFSLSLLEKIRKNLSFERAKPPAVQSQPVHPNKLAEDWQRVKGEIDTLSEAFEAILAEGLARRERYEVSLRQGVLPVHAEADGDLEASWRRIESLRHAFRETTLTVEVLSQAHAYYQEDRQRQMEDARQTVAALREELEHLQSRGAVEIKKAKHEIAGWQDQNRTLTHRLENAEAGKALAEEARHVLEAQRDTLKKQVEVSGEQAKNDREILEKLKTDLDAAHGQTGHLQEQTDELVQRLQELETSKQSLEQDRESLQVSNQQLWDSLHERMQAYDRLALTDQKNRKASNRKFQAVRREAHAWKQQTQDLLCRMHLLNASKEALEAKLSEQHQVNTAMECESLRIRQSLEMELSESRQESEVWRQRTQDLYGKLADLEKGRQEALQARTLWEQQKKELELAIQTREQQYGQLELAAQQREIQLRRQLALIRSQAAGWKKKTQQLKTQLSAAHRKLYRLDERLKRTEDVLGASVRLQNRTEIEKEALAKVLSRWQEHFTVQQQENERRRRQLENKLAKVQAEARTWKDKTYFWMRRWHHVDAHVHILEAERLTLQHQEAALSALLQLERYRLDRLVNAWKQKEEAQQQQNRNLQRESRRWKETFRREQKQALLLQRQLKTLENLCQELEHRKGALQNRLQEVSDTLDQQKEAAVVLRAGFEKELETRTEERDGWKGEAERVALQCQTLVFQHAAMRSGYESLLQEYGHLQEQWVEAQQETVKAHQTHQELTQKLHEQLQQSEAQESSQQEEIQTLTARWHAAEKKALDLEDQQQILTKRLTEIQLLLRLKEQEAAQRQLLAQQSTADLKQKSLWIQAEARQWKEKSEALARESHWHKQGHRLLWQAQADLLKEKAEIETALAAQKADFEAGLRASRQAREALAQLLDAEQVQRSGWQQQARRYLADLEVSRQDRVRLETRIHELEAVRSDLEEHVRQKEEDLERLQKKSEGSRMRFEEERQQAERTGLLRQAQIETLMRQIEVFEQEQRQSTEALLSLEKSKNDLETLLREQKEENENICLKKQRMQQAMEEQAAQLEQTESQWQARQTAWESERETWKARQRWEEENARLQNEMTKLRQEVQGWHRQTTELHEGLRSMESEKERLHMQCVQEREQLETWKQRYEEVAAEFKQFERDKEEAFRTLEKCKEEAVHQTTVTLNVQYEEKLKKWLEKYQSLEKELQAGRQLFVQRLSACVDEIEFWKRQAQEKQPTAEALPDDNPVSAIEIREAAHTVTMKEPPPENNKVPAIRAVPENQDADPLTQLRYFQEVVEKGGLFYKPPRKS